MTEAFLEFYASPGAMTTLPDHPGMAAAPTDLDGMRAAVHGLVIHPGWAAVYGVGPEALREAEVQLRSAAQMLTRAFEISDAPITKTRMPIDRVVGNCRHFTVLHVALLRAAGVPARARCGFANYFDPSKWYDHWITERWNGERWVRDDAQVDSVQLKIIKPDFDVNDQPAGRFLTGAQAWTLARNGEIDPETCGIFDMWGMAYITGNVITDLAAINAVELLPWDGWGVMEGPFEPMTEARTAFFDELAPLINGDDFDAIRERYLNDDGLRVPADITTFVNGEAHPVHLDL